ncbi:MAG: hypothetical protein CL912_07365 [Deltaproteobacteria bacterium]|nr:hypothetical protein [Deltaproteobacteria bacterium]
MPVTVCRGQAKRLIGTTQFLRGDFTHALDIYQALCNGYKCACETPHVANLKLPRLRIVEQVPDDSASYDALELLFSIEEDPLPDSAIVDGDSSPQISDEDFGRLDPVDSTDSADRALPNM